jgi:hypothetical protein
MVLRSVGPVSFVQQAGLEINTVEEEVVEEDGVAVTTEVTISGSGLTVTTGGGGGADYHEVKHWSQKRVQIRIKAHQEICKRTKEGVHAR